MQRDQKQREEVLAQKMVEAQREREQREMEECTFVPNSHQHKSKNSESKQPAMLQRRKSFEEFQKNEEQFLRKREQWVRDQTNLRDAQE